MKVAGIIAEYNPFHNGHAYHIEEVRQKTGADYVVVVMSGNFVQRGAPAILDKYTRTKMALLGGADLVIELPVVAATASAETFARTGVALLNTLDCVTHLGFGCETDDIELLDRLASLFADEPEEYKATLSSYLKEGLSFPVARAKSATEYFKKNNIIESNAESNIEGTIENNIGNVPTENRSIEDILNSPNNILAIEYLKALKKMNSSIQPCPILRQGCGYHDLTDNKSYASATAIRKRLLENMSFETDFINQLELDSINQLGSDSLNQFLHRQIPDTALPVFIDALRQSCPLQEDDFSNLLHYKLSLEQKDFSVYADVKEDLANRIENLIESYTHFSSFIEEVKAKNMTYTSISRGLLHILLNIRQSDMTLLEDLNYAPYIRLLGFRKQSAQLLKLLKSTSTPILSQLAKDQYQLSDNARHLLQLDIASAHIYTRVNNEKCARFDSKNEYRTPLIYV